MKKIKKEIDVADKEVGPKITREQYLEWRTYIYDMDIEKYKASDKEYQIKLLTRDIEISALKRALVTKELSDQEARVAKSKNDYFKYRENLGQAIGMNLDGAIIDPVTLSVKKIDQKGDK